MEQCSPLDYLEKFLSTKNVYIATDDCRLSSQSLIDVAFYEPTQVVNQPVLYGTGSIPRKTADSGNRLVARKVTLPENDCLLIDNTSDPTLAYSRTSKTAILLFCTWDGRVLFRHSFAESTTDALNQRLRCILLMMAGGDCRPSHLDVCSEDTALIEIDEMLSEVIAMAPSALCEKMCTMISGALERGHRRLCVELETAICAAGMLIVAQKYEAAATLLKQFLMPSE